MGMRDYTRRGFLKALGVGAAGLFVGTSEGGGGFERPGGTKPNVLIFFADDQGTLDVNCYGSEDLYTPNMDSLANSGVRFTQAYAHIVCCPSRAMLLTGRHPQRGGVNTWTQEHPYISEGVNMDLEEITLAEVLKGAGYKTAMFGKWHLGADFDYGPTKQGFDEFFGLRSGFIDNYNHYFLHGKGYHDLYCGTEKVFERGKFFPSLIVRESNRFLEENASVPFFLCVSFNSPHFPEQSGSRFDEMYADLPMPRRSYAKVISVTDGMIGRILDKLDELGLREETIIIFASDNGHSTARHRITAVHHNSGLPLGHNYGANGGGGNTGKWRGAKGSFYEGGIRVPAIISYPAKIPAGEVRDQAITLADFYPTILKLCGAGLPSWKLDGQSLAPIIASSEAPSHHDVMHWQWRDRWAVREGDWKLIYNGQEIDEPQSFLGNLADDEPERINYLEEHPEIVERLTGLHDEWVLDVEQN